MRILYFNLASDVFGGVRVINAHCNHLAQRGHDVGYCALNGSRIDWLAENYTVHQPYSINPREWDVMVGTEVNTWPIVKRMITPAKKFILVQALEWRFFEKTNPEWSRKVEKYYYWKDLMPIVIAKYLEREMKGRGHRKVHLISWGLDFDLFYPDEPIRPKGDKVRILVEGHGEGEVKDVDGLTWKAIEHVGRENLEVWGLSQFDARYDFDVFYKLPPQEDLRRIYSACDILIKASRFEGKPAPPFEAMACGCAVVAALNQGTDDLIYGKNCLVSKYNGLKLNRNVKKLVEDESLRRELTENGLQYAREHFQWRDKIDRLEAVYSGGMKHFAIITTAGPIDALSDVYDLRVYGKPKALLSLGEETVIQRVTRQLDELGVESWVGIGKAGIEGWTEEFVREFQKLSCNILVSPSLTPISPSDTGRFMLEHLQGRLAPSDRIIMIPGDFVFADETLRELLEYPAPCIYGFMGEDDRCFIVTGATIQDFLDWSAPFESWGASIGRLRELGFAYCVRGEAGHAADKRNEGFAEIDFTYEWEAAKDLVKEDNLCRVQETN